LIVNVCSIKGDVKEHFALTKGIEARQAQRKTDYSPACGIAGLYADLGDKDKAFRWLNTAYQERDLSLLTLKTDFRYDSLRSDPRALLSWC
jgi:hypothetical protein